MDGGPIRKMEISEQPQEIVERSPDATCMRRSRLVSALLVVVLVFTFLVRLMGVSGPSMIPTRRTATGFVVNSLLCGDYQVGDIVIAHKEHPPLTRKPTSSASPPRARP